MIPKPLNDITLADVERLKDNGIPEGKTIEYKAELPSENKRFLAAVTSFANTTGGDLLIGVAEKGGAPTDICGIEVSDADKLMLKLESTCRDNVEPRLRPLNYQLLGLPNGRYVLLIRVERSWNAPHRAWKDGPFHARNSSGKYPLDVGELRTAFTLANTVTERIRNFRVERLAKIGAGETPVPLERTGTMVLHLVPVSAFSSPTPTRIQLDSRERFSFAPFDSGAGCQQVNLDGYVLFTTRREESRIYAQVFRSGAVEAVAALGEWVDGRWLPALWIEKRVINTLEAFTAALAKKGVEPPFLVSLSFLNIDGYGLHSGSESLHEPISAANLLLPEVLIEQPGFDASKELRLLFDMLWNAFGHEQSPSYDESGNWQPKGRQ